MNRNEKTLNILALIIIPPILTILTERMYINTPVMLRVGTALLFLNYLFWILTAVFLLFLFGKLRIALRIQTVIMLAIGLLNHYLYEFRGMPVQPWDIRSLKTALSVADNYDFSLSSATVIMIVIYVIIFILCGRLKLTVNKEGRINLITRLLILSSSVAAVFLLSLFIRWDKAAKMIDLFDKLFVYEKMVEKNGTAVTFIYAQKFLSTDPPEGYTKDRAVTLLEEISDSRNDIDNEQTPDSIRPDIIVIMNESFSDLRVLENFETNKPVMPFTDSILAGMKNTASGHLTVPVLGGNTPNTEFEFLTGNSMRFLPQGSVPYQQFISSETETLASVLKKNGYDTVAMHPYKRKGWDRDKVYEYFGFDSFISDESFNDPELIRDYISDTADYDMVMDLYENHTGNPLFIFNVTMQNHGAYWDRYDNFTPMIKAAGIDDREFGCYLSLIGESDKAVCSLTEKLSSSDRPVILVFFGDHQPADTTVDELYSMYNKNVSDLNEEDRAKRYIVPFFIWTNYDIPTETNLRLTPGQLGLKVLKMSGTGLTDYQLFSDSFYDGKYSDSDFATVQYYEMFERQPLNEH